MAKNSGVPVEKPNGPIVIYVGRQATGATYELEPLSRRRLSQAFPQTRRTPKVFLGYEKEQDFEQVHGPLWPQVATILTGLSLDQLDKLGGARLYDPAEEAEWDLKVATSQ
jgi:hypothetical protein